MKLKTGDSIVWIIFSFKTGNLVDANASEEDKIKAMMRQSTIDFDPAK